MGERLPLDEHVPWQDAVRLTLGDAFSEHPELEETEVQRRLGGMEDDQLRQLAIGVAHEIETSTELEEEQRRPAAEAFRLLLGIHPDHEGTAAGPDDIAEALGMSSEDARLLLGKALDETRALIDGGAIVLSRPRTTDLNAVEDKPSKPTKKTAKKSAKKAAKKRRAGGSGTSSKEGEPEEDLIREYLTDIGGVPLLTAEDEKRLAQVIEKGAEARAALEADNLLDEPQLAPQTKGRLNREIRAGMRAEQDFVRANLRLVVSIAKRYQNQGLPLLDLIQEGNMGLMHAVEKFDWRKGFKFSTYSTWWIRQAITRGLANTGRTIRLPVHAGDTLKRVSRARREYVDEFGREPTEAELQKHMDVDDDAFEKVMHILAVARDPLSLSNPLKADSDTELGDVVEDKLADDPVEAALLAGDVAWLRSRMDQLQQRERDVLILRFGLDDGRPRTLEEVGYEFKVTRERIRHIELAAVRQLQDIAIAEGNEVQQVRVTPAERQKELRAAKRAAKKKAK